MLKVRMGLCPGNLSPTRPLSDPVSIFDALLLKFSLPAPQFCVRKLSVPNFQPLCAVPICSGIFQAHLKYNCPLETLTTNLK